MPKARVKSSLVSALCDSTHRYGQTHDRRGVPHRMYDLPILDIVHLDHLIQTSRQDPLGPTVKRHAADRLLVVAQCPHTLAACHGQVPDSKDGATRGQRHVRSSGREEQDVLYRQVRAVGHGNLGLARSDIPKLDGRIVGSGEEERRVVGIEDKGTDVIGVAIERLEAGLGGNVPETNSPVVRC